MRGFFDSTRVYLPEIPPHSSLRTLRVVLENAILKIPQNVLCQYIARWENIRRLQAVKDRSIEYETAEQQKNCGSQGHSWH
jgi:hypothetical protein